MLRLRKRGWILGRRISSCRCKGKFNGKKFIAGILLESCKFKDESFHPEIIVIAARDT